MKSLEIKAAKAQWLKEMQAKYPKFNKTMWLSNRAYRVAHPQPNFIN